MPVEEAAVLLRGRGHSGSLVPVAWHGGSELAWPDGRRQGDSAVRRALTEGLLVAEKGWGRRLRAAAPLVVAGEVRGVLAVVGAASAPSLGNAQLEMLGELAQLAAASLEERDLRARAEAIIEAGVDVLARAVDIRDDYTGRHSAEVGNLARRVGQRIGMPSGQLAVLEWAARLHDVGKLGVPDAILQKPGPLDEREWEVMRRHPEWGAEMVARVPGLEELARLVGAHHERWDGSGYPNGLTGEAIPLASRVISVCDAFEAMVSRRPYRAPLSIESALRELLAAAGSQFDPQVVAAVEKEVEVAAG
jgi:HD-GYP domain-containing protein (c-di-GMP phosphodiesterase class II)